MWWCKLSVVLQIVLVILSKDDSSVSSLAPPQARQTVSIASGEDNRDYLSLDEEEEEFPAESIALLRSMAANFRSGLAQSLTSGGAAADARSGDGAGGGPEGGSPMMQVMKYLSQIIQGFQTMRKSMTDMFQSIASAGGQGLANRIQKRLSGWMKQAQSAGEGVAGQAPGAAGAGQVPNAARVPF